eukprot:COSAG02_NODE_575_length_20117_cov_5.801139_21_plen_80_part_00
MALQPPKSSSWLCCRSQIWLLDEGSSTRGAGLQQEGTCRRSATRPAGTARLPHLVRPAETAITKECTCLACTTVLVQLY